MTHFKKSNVDVLSKCSSETTSDFLFWKKFGVPVLIKEFGIADFIDFSPTEPHYFAVTCSVKIQMYNSITKQPQKSYSGFRECAYGGNFRSDGRLLCAGGAERHIRLYDTSSRALLRLFKGHKNAVHRCFFTMDTSRIASFSDDKTVCLWDIPSEKRMCNFSHHEDYVRAGAVSPVSSDILASGGYDNIVKLYDTRTDVSIFTMDHEAPVESLLILPSGGIILSAGGTEIRVWDILAGGRLLTKICQHHKTVTCLRMTSDNTRFLSGSLDRHVKIYDISTFQVVHSLNYPNPVVSLAINKGDQVIAVGMANGSISVSKREDEICPSKLERRKISYKYLPDNMKSKNVDVLVAEKRSFLMAKYDVCFRKFQYSKALDLVLRPYIITKNPAVTTNVCQELIRRNGLYSAVAGRNGKSLQSLIRFLVKYIGDIRFSRVLIDVANIVLDIYSDSIEDLEPEVAELFCVLANRVQTEEQFIEQLLLLQGTLELVLSGASAKEMTSLAFSACAQENYTTKI